MQDEEKLAPRALELVDAILKDSNIVEPTFPNHIIEADGEYSMTHPDYIAYVNNLQLYKSVVEKVKDDAGVQFVNMCAGLPTTEFEIAVYGIQNYLYEITNPSFVGVIERAYQSGEISDVDYTVCINKYLDVCKLKNISPIIKSSKPPLKVEVESVNVDSEHGDDDEDDDFVIERHF